jgi:hypothetical protein
MKLKKVLTEEQEKVYKGEKKPIKGITMLN